MSVFLRKQNLKKGVYLSFIEAFYEPHTKNTIQKIYPIKQICSFIRDYNVLVIDSKYYTTEYNDLIPFIEERFQVTLDRKILTEQNIKNIFEAIPQHTTKILN